MLQTETVEQSTLALLMKLQAMPELAGFHLAGGTALALHYGHRKSIDYFALQFRLLHYS
ncbi:MAG: hypothetical protein RIM99_16910 [Cyclobacteriaceae bacterium]